MWFELCRSNDGHLRVPSLWNHIKQNNNVLKVFFSEKHLPEHQQLHLLWRMCRFLVMALILIAANAYTFTWGLVDVANILSYRSRCLIACTQAGFPTNGCQTVNDEVISYRGNVYDKFFRFSRPVGPPASEYMGDYINTYNECQNFALDPSRALWQHLYSGFFRHFIRQPSYAEICDLFGPHSLFCDNRERRLHTCFTGCRRPKDTPEIGYAVDTRPTCVAGDEKVKPLLCIFPEDIDADTFFSGVADATCIFSSTSDPTRGSYRITWPRAPTLCVGAAQLLITLVIAAFFEFLFDCLLLSVLNTRNELVENSLAMRSRKCWYIFIASAIVGAATALLYSSATIIRKLHMEESFMYSCLLVFAGEQALFFTLHPIIWWVFVKRCGKLQTSGAQEYDEDYLNIFTEETSLLDSCRARLADVVRSALFSRASLCVLLLYMACVLVEYLLLNDVTSYNIVRLPDFVLAQVVARVTDIAFAFLFTLELLLKLTAYGFAFLKAPVEFFDCAVILTGFVLFITGHYLVGFGVLRVLRLLDALALLQDYSDSQKSEFSGDKSTALERASSFLETMLINVHVPKYFKTELEWVWQCIVSNQVYESQAIETDEGVPPQTVHVPVEAIHRRTQSVTRSSRAQPRNSKISYTTSSAVLDNYSQGKITGQILENLRQPDPKMMEMALYKSQTRNLDPLTHGGAILKPSASMFAKSSKSGGMQSAGSRRSLRLNRNRQQIDVMGILYQSLQITGTEEEQVMEALRSFDDWQWDALHASEVCATNLLPIIFTRSLATWPTLIMMFPFDLGRMFDFAKVVQLSFQKKVKFHCAAHAASMIQCTHYFLTSGKVGQFFSEYDVFLSLFCALVCHYGHPGVTTNFLIKSRHPLAIRYNDMGVNEGYVASQISSLLQQEEFNFFGEMESLRQVFRLHMIDILLSFDISQSAHLVAMLRAKVAVKFNASVRTDKQLLLAILLRAAEYNFAARPGSLYMKWKDRLLEEFFYMGDTEKQLALSVTPFCDRELTNANKCIMAFVEVAVKPLMSVLVLGLCPQLQSDLLETLDANQKNTAQKVDSRDRF